MRNRRFPGRRVNKDKATNFSHKNRARNFHLFGFGEGNRRGEEIISSFHPLFPVGKKKKTSPSQLEQEKKIWGEDRVDGLGSAELWMTALGGGDKASSPN